MTALPLPVAVPVDLTIRHLDEDWAVPCERKPPIGQPCTKPAEWVCWSVRCCPDRAQTFLLCDRHKADLLRTELVAVCSHCDEIFEPARTGFRLIEPLNRRTK